MAVRSTPPPRAEVEILARRHPKISAANLDVIVIVIVTVAVANAIRHAADLTGRLSVRATEEAWIYLEHELFAEDGKRALPEIMKTSFCGRFPGRWDDVKTDAGAVWSLIRATLGAHRVPLPEAQAFALARRSPDFASSSKFGSVSCSSLAV